ncbi:MAG: hypothetical protein J2P17_20375, partial [Mycobacterium sp.]|nr:hypothetical protein [Mycobacterium sp.]
YTFPESEARWNWVDDKGQLPDGSRARPDAFKAAEVIMAPRDAAAQMYGLVGGEKSPIKLVILWLRGYGLWTVRTHLDGDTEPWVTVAPASDDSLTASLAELITD